MFLLIAAINFNVNLRTVDAEKFLDCAITV